MLLRMKVRIKSALIALELFVAVGLHSQGFYPLTAGTKWNYTYHQPGTNYGSIWVSTGDTLFPSGIRYTAVISASGSAMYLRNIDSRVLRRTSSDTLESTYVDWSRPNGQTVVNGPNSTTYYTIDQVEIFGRSWRRFSITTQNTGQFSFSYGSQFIDSIGFSYSFSFDESGESTATLIGFVFDGISYGDLTRVNDKSSSIAQEYHLLFYNYPNPFNPSTVIEYELKRRQQVFLSVFDLLGRQVEVLVNDETENAGRHHVTFDGSGLSTGIYYYSIKAGTLSETKRMLLLK